MLELIPGRKGRLAAAISATIGLSGLICSPATAALGGDVASIESDRQALGGSHVVTRMQHYDRHEIATASGLRVHEFADTTGRVFALSWDGQAQPDLQTLLGNHYSEYSSAAKVRRVANHHVFSAQSGGLVIQIIRRPRGLTGMASVPALMPAGIDAQELR
ncbi:MAG TPA: DUF2844 domain-containing protein [Steroidobacteraceae bacterium]|jgi:hypothetical protein|nr:DUF2844 domain-containing protein [Steroidobacteraceae bacterium]